MSRDGDLLAREARQWLNSQTPQPAPPKPGLWHHPCLLAIFDRPSTAITFAFVLLGVLASICAFGIALTTWTGQ